VKLSEELSWRGFVNQTTYDDVSVLDGDPISFYFGVDPSADSMQIGNFASMMMVRHFVDHGHKAFLLVGGATGLVGGDPDGKDKTREIKTVDEVEKNKAGIATQYSQVLASDKFTLVDNYDWFKDINYLDFLRDIGTRVPMSQMLSREFVQARLGSDGNGISYAEFSYSLIQGYDFVYLFRNHGVTLQLCGADQWGNCVAGVDLIRRLESSEAHVYSMPLIMNKSTGAKFGKSEDGTIWLDAKKTSVYAFYQYWLNCDDEGVSDYLKIFTLLDRDTIENLTKQVVEDPTGRAAQKTLAHETTMLVHGQQRTESVERVTNVLFGGADFVTLQDEDLNLLAQEIPVAPHGKTIVDVLVETNLASSNGDARRLIDNGAISVNSKKITDDQIVNTTSLIKKGKNSFVLVR